jgi:hypothetical protein
MTMSHFDTAGWTVRTRNALAGHEEALLRRIGDKLLRLRNRPILPELIDKLLAFVANPVAIDRRLKGLPGEARELLALMHMSRQPLWQITGLLELLSCVSDADGMGVLGELFEQGFLLPLDDSSHPKRKGFQDWLSRGSSSHHRLFAHPMVAERAARGESALLAPPDRATEVQQIREADGLEVFMRLGALWQLVRATPIRLTQQGEFFKRDDERLANDPLLAGALSDGAGELPHPGPFLVALAMQLGILQQEESQLLAGELPTSWNNGHFPAVCSLFAALPQVTAWNADQGWHGFGVRLDPYGSAGLLAFALLSRLESHEWVAPVAIGRAIAQRHCAWQGRPRALDSWAERYLLGLGVTLRLVQWGFDNEGVKVVRLSVLGRAVLGLADLPTTPELPKTLLVQPNLEIVAYRQGVTPALIGALTGFADWATIGAACTLRLAPASVYRGLESGCGFEQMVQTLEQHGVRELPDAVLQSLRTWAGKRERLTVYTAATLLEFNAAEDLEAALARGLVGVRVAERFLLIPREDDVDYRHLRLLGSRDYGQPPGQCVQLHEDGVTLTVDVTRADLWLESELNRFAAPLPSPGGGYTLGGPEASRSYRLTLDSLRRGRDSGLTLPWLDTWFTQRTGQALPPAARLLLAEPWATSLRLTTTIVLHVPAAELADGLLQWPETRGLIDSRLGPLTLAVAPEHVPALRERLQGLGLAIDSE